VLHDLLSHVCRPVVEGVYLQESKAEANKLLERLLNQNEQAFGLFYLHPDDEIGINVPSIALLRVTVTLRVDHYEVLKRARRGRLSSEFQNKLGWLVGNLFSRIGTQDWNDSPERKKEFESLVKNHLEAGELYQPIWVREPLVVAAKEKGIQLDRIPKQELVAILDANRAPSAKEAAADHALKVIKEVMSDISEEDLARIRNRLLNDALFSKVFKSSQFD
jgi:hypothetical protein